MRYRCIAPSSTCRPSLIAPVVPHGAVLPPASFHAVRPRLLASAMKSCRHFASPSIPIASIWARMAAFDERGRGRGDRAGRLAVRAERDARRPGCQPDRVECRLVDARPGDAAALDPQRVVGRRRVQLVEREDRRVVELAEVPAAEVVQIQRPSASSSAFALYMASAVARLVTRSSRTTCVQQW